MIPYKNTSFTLFTDLYQLTMAYGYWKLGKSEQQSVFHLYFRNNPFGGGYTICAGLEYVVRYVESLKFSLEDIAYLRSLKDKEGNPLLSKEFLDYLLELKFSCTIDALTEGTICFPNSPILRVKGPILQAQLIETALLNIINFQSLIATKATRVCYVAGKDPVFEFGTRRSQGPDGALSSTRAAYIGGCSATSNVMGGKIFGIPVVGTHAHSWVMAFETEKESFQKYIEVMSGNVILLVDTYNSKKGIEMACEIGKELAKNNKKLLGIRLDSGDLAYMSQYARKKLNEAHLHHTAIIASNDLDEYIIEDLKQTQKAKIDMWGVGTKLVTAYQQPAMGGVYKLSALKNTSEGSWEYKIKISEQTEKVSIPGVLQTYRFYYPNGKMMYDMVIDENLVNLIKHTTMIDPFDGTKRKKILVEGYEKLLVPIFKEGKRVYSLPTLSDIRDKVIKNIQSLDTHIKRLKNPHIYPVGLEQELYAKRERMILEIRGL